MGRNQLLWDFRYRPEADSLPRSGTTLRSAVRSTHRPVPSSRSPSRWIQFRSRSLRAFDSGCKRDRLLAEYNRGVCRPLHRVPDLRRILSGGSGGRHRCINPGDLARSLPNPVRDHQYRSTHPYSSNHRLNDEAVSELFLRRQIVSATMGSFRPIPYGSRTLPG